MAENHTTIRVSERNAEWLHDLKNRADSYNDVLTRLREEHDGSEVAQPAD